MGRNLALLLAAFLFALVSIAIHAGANRDALAGCFAFVAGVSMLLGEIVLSPRNETFPSAPWWARWPMFLAGCAIVFRGMGLIDRASIPVDTLLARGQARLDTEGLVTWAFFAFAHCTWAMYLLSLQKDPEVWKRVRRVGELAKAPAAAFQLARAGWAVFTPGSRTPIHDHGIPPIVKPRGNPLDG